MYNLILAGFDCKTARLKKYGYNISIIRQEMRSRVAAPEDG